MDAASLEMLALRAVELVVQGREDPRLLCATRARVPGPARSARLFAGLANAAEGRQALALFGVAGRTLQGLDAPPGDRWADDVADRFPGVVPDVSTVCADVDGALVLAVAIADPGNLVVARRADRIVIPWFDGFAVADAPPRPGVRPGPGAAAPDRQPSAVRVVAARLERVAVEGAADVVAWRGAVDVELPAGPGRIADVDCAASVLVPGRAGAIPLAVQIHPLDREAGVRRRAAGIEIRASHRARLHLAAAGPSEPLDPTGPAHLVVSLGSADGSPPAVCSLLLARDRSRPPAHGS